MTRTLPKDDSGTDFIQFRGYQTSVTIDDFGLRFTTRQQSTPDEHDNIRMHEPLPVAHRDDLLDPDSDTPDNAIPTEIAEAITNGDFANELVCWGVVCEWPLTDEDDALTGAVCGEIFDTPRSLNGHLRVHYDEDADIEEEEDDDVAESDERDVVTGVANDETAIADAVADESNTTSDADESDESSDTDRNSDSNTEDN